MKNKRKIINKYLSQFETMDTGNVVSYYDAANSRMVFIWYKKDDKYLQGPPDFKFYSLKQMCAHVIRLMKIKVFW